MKKMLFVNGNFNDIPLIESAHKFGFYTITSGNDPHGKGHDFSDQYVPCDYSDKEAMLKVAEKLGIDAICSCGNDFGATTAAYVAENLGLPGHDSYAVSKVFHEKDEFKRVVNEYQLLSPHSAMFTSEEEAAKYIKNVRFPQIIKPVDLGGGKGISVAHNPTEGIESIKLAFNKSKLKHIVIEDYIQGTQHGFICFIKNRKVVFDYSSNDYSYLNPYMVWIASGYPADGYEEVRSQIISDVELLAEKLNMADGFLTIQYMMSNGKPYYLETMRRCLGNLHFKCISKDCGVDIYDLFVAAEAGLNTDDYVRKFHFTGLYSGFLGIYAKQNGVFDSVEFDSEFKDRIFETMMLQEKGYRIDDYLSDKLGMVWYSFRSREEREYFLNKRYDLFHVNLHNS